MTSRHPTTVEVAAFRHDAAMRHFPGAYCHPCEACGSRPDGTPEIAGAWPSERRHGIGYRPGPDDLWPPSRTARFMAGAARSMEYRRLSRVLGGGAS